MWKKIRKWGENWERLGRVGGKKGEKERGIEERKARKRAKVWEDKRVGGSGDYRLSGVFYLWSKCTLAFLLSSPQMQLDSSLAKQTQMKWLLNDFLGNPPRQGKPSIWSLLFPSLPPTLLLFLLTHILHIPHFDFLSFSLCILLWFACFSFSFHLYCHIFLLEFLFLYSDLLYFFLLPWFLALLFCCSFFMPLLLLPPSDLDKQPSSIWQTF